MSSQQRQYTEYIVPVSMDFKKALFFQNEMLTQQNPKQSKGSRWLKSCWYKELQQNRAMSCSPILMDIWFETVLENLFYTLFEDGYL